MAVEKKPVKIMETVLRDAHQSLIATRMTTEQMLPIIDKMDKIGYHAVECWGGATFDASLRFLHEDPWMRLRKLRDGFKNTKLQMLFRGQNILGYRPYADDVVEYFVQKSIANGIDIIRIFDCMNDLRNLQTAVSAANKEKGVPKLSRHKKRRCIIGSSFRKSVARLFYPISLFEQNIDHPITKISLNDDFTLFGGTTYTTFAFKKFRQCFEVLLFTDKTFDQRHLFSCTLFSIEPYAQILTGRRQGFSLILILLIGVLKIGIGRVYDIQTAFPVVVTHISGI